MQTIEQLLDRAALLSKEEQYQQVIDLLTDKVLAQYNDPELYKERSDAWYYLEKYDKAIADLDKAIGLDPEDSHAWYERGNAWQECGELVKAMHDFDKAIRLDPDNAWAWYSRGSILYEREKYHQAVEQYTKFLQREPYQDLGYYKRGRAWHALEEYDKAILDYTMAIGIAPATEYYWFYRASARHDKIEGDPGSPETEFEIAIRDYSEALRLRPSRQEAWCNRGTLLAVLERNDEALADFEKALQLDPEDELARESIQYLKNKLNKSDIPAVSATVLSHQEIQDIREKAAGFLDRLRKQMDAKFNAKFKKAKGGYSHGFDIESYHPETKRPLVAGIQGWLPEIMPTLAKWKEVTTAGGEKILDVTTPDGQEFWPSLVGIPIKKNLWLAIVGYKQYLIDEAPLDRKTKRWPNINLLLMRVIGNIRKGYLDREIVFGEYTIPSVQTEFETALEHLFYLPRKK